MKAGIHPEYVDTTITCACGEVIRTRTTRPDIRVEVCSKCHPFFTGKQNSRRPANIARLDAVALSRRQIDLHLDLCNGILKLDCQ